MRTISILLLFLTTMISCGQNKNYTKQAVSDYYSNNEDKFSFLIFERQKIDSFFKIYSPIDFKNAEIRNRFKDLTTVDTSKATVDNFKKHTNEPTSSDHTLALNAIKAASSDDSKQKYFNVSLNYLFFFECLPGQFKNKWTQTQMGDFMFNVTFFNLMRTKCKVFDEHIYGSSGYWDDNMRKIFKDAIFNEITSDKASEIKNCIANEKSFESSKLQPDKDVFISILDNVVEKKWRLFLLDKN